MTVSPRDWQDLASVFRAGAERSACWEFNVSMQQQSEVLEAMAARCDEMAVRRNVPVDDLADLERADRQRTAYGTYRCKRIVITEDHVFHGRCVLHRDHIVDLTDHADFDGNRMPMEGDHREVS